MINTAQWARRGSEAQAEDAALMARGVVGDATSADIEAELMEHFAADLDELSAGEREEAVDALMRGYRCGA